jgi:hypothetical protein
MNKLPELHVVDDGTMDTCLVCQECGSELRYSSDGIDRDESGSVLDCELERLSEEHSDECEGSESASYKPERVNGEWIQ